MSVIARDVIEHLAAIRWYQAGAVIPWAKAAPEVQERYREKVRSSPTPTLGAVEALRDLREYAISHEEAAPDAYMLASGVRERVDAILAALGGQ